MSTRRYKPKKEKEKKDGVKRVYPVTRDKRIEDGTHPVYECLEIEDENKQLAKIEELVAKGESVTFLDSSCNSLLLWAARHGRARLVKFLLDQGMDINKAELHRMTPLSNACKNGHLEVVKTLLDNGAKMDSKSIQCACANGHLEVVRILLDRGSEIDVGVADNQLPLFLASNPKIVKLLKLHGANIDARGESGRTSLMEAYGADEVKKLLKMGADVNVRNNDGNTALDIAKKYYNPEKVKILTEATKLSAENYSH